MFNVFHVTKLQGEPEINGKSLKKSVYLMVKILKKKKLKVEIAKSQSTETSNPDVRDIKQQENQFWITKIEYDVCYFTRIYAAHGIISRIKYKKYKNHFS